MTIAHPHQEKKLSNNWITQLTSEFLFFVDDPCLTYSLSFKPVEDLQASYTDEITVRIIFVHNIIYLSTYYKNKLAYTFAAC